MSFVIHISFFWLGVYHKPRRTRFGYAGFWFTSMMQTSLSINPLKDSKEYNIHAPN